MNTKWGIYSAPNFQLKWEVGDRFVNVVTGSQESIKPYHDDDTNEDPKSECQLKTIHKETSVWALSVNKTRCNNLYGRCLTWIQLPCYAMLMCWHRPTVYFADSQAWLNKTVVVISKQNTGIIWLLLLFMHFKWQSRTQSWKWPESFQPRNRLSKIYRWI
jgi:hypothetical protein